MGSPFYFGVEDGGILGECGMESKSICAGKFCGDGVTGGGAALAFWVCLGMIGGMELQEDQNIQLYLREIGKVELLTPEEEVALAARIREGDEGARQRMIRANLRLVVHIAAEYARLGLPLLDLISEGNIGLMKAVDRFDPGKGGKLSTYAAWWIKQGIRRALANQGKTVRLPSHLVEKLFRFRREQERMIKELGRMPTDGELARRMGVGRGVVAQWRRVALQTASLDAPFGGSGGEDPRTLADGLAAKGETPAEALVSEQLKEEMRKHLDELGEREREILTRRFGLDGKAEETLGEVGKRLGVSRERVRQLQERALGRLREELLKEG